MLCLQNTCVFSLSLLIFSGRCPSLISWKYKSTRTQSEVSIEYQIQWCKLLDNYLRQDLLEMNQRLSQQRRSVQQWRNELQRQILKQR